MGGKERRRYAMSNAPKTKAEAWVFRYGTWAGCTKGQRYDPYRCAEEVWGSRTWIPYQCSRKPGYGPDGLYCKQHAKQYKEASE